MGHDRPGDKVQPSLGQRVAVETVAALVSSFAVGKFAFEQLAVIEVSY